MSNVLITCLHVFAENFPEQVIRTITNPSFMIIIYNIIFPSFTPDIEGNTISVCAYFKNGDIWGIHADAPTYADVFSSFEKFMYQSNIVFFMPSDTFLSLLIVL